MYRYSGHASAAAATTLIPLTDAFITAHSRRTACLWFACGAFGQELPKRWRLPMTAMRCAERPGERSERLERLVTGDYSYVQLSVQAQ